MQMTFVVCVARVRLGWLLALAVSSQQSMSWLHRMDAEIDNCQQDARTCQCPVPHARFCFPAISISTASSTAISRPPTFIDDDGTVILGDLGARRAGVRARPERTIVFDLARPTRAHRHAVLIRRHGARLPFVIALASCCAHRIALSCAGLHRSSSGNTTSEDIRSFVCASAPARPVELLIFSYKHKLSVPHWITGTDGGAQVLVRWARAATLWASRTCLAQRASRSRASSPPRAAPNIAPKIYGVRRVPKLQMRQCQPKTRRSNRSSGLQKSTSRTGSMRPVDMEHAGVDKQRDEEALDEFVPARRASRGTSPHRRRPRELHGHHAAAHQDTDGQGRRIGT
ncbi:hypothetical protein FA95DRAFT_1298440 [Auriscalpium vulgare]|uniref:Uncharacterized protein n=1 Tax=Auriscalpium vulgare TaxID=40419 RepID=A0ACB8R1R3_9AGAM|nr:hypothetical protein FA95DRAFT_1298440 [Auriscalpium vulgare]